MGSRFIAAAFLQSAQEASDFDHGSELDALDRGGGVPVPVGLTFGGARVAAVELLEPTVEPSALERIVRRSRPEGIVGGGFSGPAVARLLGPALPGGGVVLLQLFATTVGDFALVAGRVAGVLFSMCGGDSDFSPVLVAGGPAAVAAAAALRGRHRAFVGGDSSSDASSAGVEAMSWWEDVSASHLGTRPAVLGQCADLKATVRTYFRG